MDHDRETIKLLLSEIQRLRLYIIVMLVVVGMSFLIAFPFMFHLVGQAKSDSRANTATIKYLTEKGTEVIHRVDDLEELHEKGGSNE